MGELEKESKTRTRRANLRKIILATVKTAGILGIAVLAPNVVSGMAKLGMIPGKRQTEFVNTSRERLIRQGLLVRQNGFLRITPRGEKTLRTLELEDFKLRKPKHWDHKWRVLIFDIEERRRTMREKVRRALVLMGFERLQDSVWVYPYDCEDVITLLKSDFHIGKDVLYLIVESIEHDQHLRRIFSLK